MLKFVDLVLFLPSYFFVVAKSYDSTIVQSSVDANEFLENFNEIFQESFQELYKKDDNRVKENRYEVFGYPEVQTGKGKVSGQTNKHGHSFYGIPYAEAPIGKYRFMPPIMKTNVGNYNGSKESRVRCWQLDRDLRGFEFERSEDCLLLNIHVPSSVKKIDLENGNFDSLLPVMFWIHGGAYFLGGGTYEFYEGRYLSETTNTIIVSINYRLGPFGFFYHQKEDINFLGNQGFKDQQLALQWVVEEIKNFGGDPSKITIFGESAGAQSVMLHLASRTNQPQFIRAIMESNPAFYDYPDVERAAELSEQFIEDLGCADNYNSDIECLRNIDAELVINKTLIVHARFGMAGDHRSMVEPFRPMVDGVEFPKQPLDMFQDGDWHTNVDVVIGTNRQELGIISAKFQGRKITEDLYIKLTTYLVGEELEPNVTSEYMKLVPENAGRLFDYTDIIAQEVGDLYFVCPSRLLARFISKTSLSKNSYMYSWEHQSCSDPTDDCYYSCHGCEVSYVFNTRNYTDLRNDESDQYMSLVFSDFWGSFAHTGVPTSQNTENWIKYKSLDEENSEDWEIMHMKYPRAEKEANYMEELCDFWDSLNYYVKIKKQPTPNENEDSSGEILKMNIITIVATIFNTLFVFYIY